MTESPASVRVGASDPARAVPAAAGTSVATVVLALVGLALGVAIALATIPPFRENPYPALPAAAEPAAAESVAAALRAEDSRDLARLLDAEQLQALGEAMQPLFSVRDVKFLGAVERQGETLAAYTFQGRSRAGEDVAVGVVFHVVNGKVVGVN